MYLSDTKECELEVKLSTMSSSSGNSTELSFIDSDNSATEKGKNTNLEYAHINDEDVKRPLPPIPDWIIMPPLRKNSTPCFQSWKEVCSKNCGYFRLILSITLSVLAVAALGVVIYLVVPKEPGCCSTRPPPPDILDLLQESHGQNVTILQNVMLNFTKRIWSLEGRAISIEISYTDEGSIQILLNVDISSSQCIHAGKYFVLLYGSNGKAEKSLSYNVTAPCPCEAEYELISNRVVKCELKVIGCTTLSFDKVSGENIGRILYQSRICIPDNVETYRFSATWMSDGTLITSINFSPVQCQDEGNYSLTVTSKAGTKVHYIYVHVIDHPEKPTISIPNGLFGNKESALQCQASTGCRNASVTVQATAPNCQDYFPWETNLTQIHYPVGGIWKTNVTLILAKFEVNLNFLQNRLFRCTYYMDGKSSYSQPIRMQIIPADFCTDKTSKCDYPHPYDCKKYITCTIIPLERTCQSGLHFMDSNNCEGRCNYPNQAMCNIHQSDGGYCGNT